MAKKLFYEANDGYTKKKKLIDLWNFVSSIML